MEPSPPPETPSRPRKPADSDPDRVSTENGQTDQEIDTAGTEADEPAVGSTLDQGIERDERRRPVRERP